MRGVALFLLFALVACATGNGVTPTSASSELKEWRTVTGKPPSKKEFAAVVAACEDRAKSENSNTPLEGCLADYGLYRVQ